MPRRFHVSEWNSESLLPSRRPELPPPLAAAAASCAGPDRAGRAQIRSRFRRAHTRVLERALTQARARASKAKRREGSQRARGDYYRLVGRRLGYHEPDP